MNVKTNRGQMMKSRNVLISALIISISFSFGVLFLVGHDSLYGLFSSFSFYRWLLPVVICFVGLSLVIGILFLHKTGRWKPEHKTYPIYAISILFEGIGEIMEGSYQLIFVSSGFLMIIIALSIDIRKKIGLYHFFVGRNKRRARGQP
jgi:hypothetical protein